MNLIKVIGCFTYVAIFAFGSGLVCAGSLTVGSYNIHHGEGIDRVTSLQRIAEVIDDMDVDVIALQEVDFANSRSDYIDQAESIASRLDSLSEGSEWVALPAPAISFGGGEYGNAILYNAKSVSQKKYRVVTLPDPYGDGARSIGISTFEKEGALFQFGTTHLTHINNPSPTVPGLTIQEESMSIIQQELDGSIPAIVSGDFNAGFSIVNHESMEYWEKSLGWNVDSPKEQSTYPGISEAIDFNTSSNTIGWSLVSSRVVVDGRTKVASDHYPIVTTYQTVPTSTDQIFLEAENYTYMSGVQTESTNDTGGGLNVGYIDAGDWLAYHDINIPTSGNYKIEFRVAALDGGSLSFERAGGHPVYGALKVPDTDGWQNWTTISMTAYLDAGVQNFGIGVPEGGWNLNWIRLTAQ